jgi:cellulose synthase operon protein B
MVGIGMCVAFTGCRREEESQDEVTDNIVIEQPGIEATHVLLADSMVQWLQSMQGTLGLLPTARGSELISLYDNALAACCFVASQQYENAELIFDYYHQRLSSEMQSGSGGYFQFRYLSGQPTGNRWMGDNAWLLIALNNYAHATGSAQYDDMRAAISNWLQSLQDTDGGLWGGTDINGAQLGKVTEGNIDAFNAVSGFTAYHAGILQFIEQQRWDSTEQLIVSWPGSNYYYALDNFSWGYCAFEGFPDRILDEAVRFQTTQWHSNASDSITGYCFDEDRDAVWLEGTGQMAVAFTKAGRMGEANNVLHELATAVVHEPGAMVGVGLPYASNIATGYGNGQLWSGADIQPCTAATAWFIMAALRFDPMALNYGKGIPVNSKFW